MRIWAGCYERFLFEFQLDTLSGAAYELSQVACQPAHRSSVKCLCAAPGYVATGGADDQIHLFDVSRRESVDLGFVVNPVEGPVPCVAFVCPSNAPKPTHLLSGSATGPICIWRAGGEWEHVKVMSGHRGMVTAVAAHPAAPLALSVSWDRQLRLWDLVKGASAYQAPLGGEGELVVFAPSGARFAVGTGATVTLHSIKGETVASLSHARRVLACAPLSDDVYVTGAEGGAIALWDIRKASEPVAANEHAHASRVRSVAVFRPAPSSGREAGGQCIASVSSDGAVKVWDAGAFMAGGAVPALCQIAAKARFTCLSVTESPTGVKPRSEHKKRKVQEHVAVDHRGAAEGGVQGLPRGPRVRPAKPTRDKDAVKALDQGLGTHGHIKGMGNGERGKLEKNGGTQGNATLEQCLPKSCDTGGTGAPGAKAAEAKRKVSRSKKKHATER